MGFGPAAGHMAGAGPTFGMGWCLMAAQELIFQRVFMNHFLGLKLANKHGKMGYFCLEGHFSDFFEDSQK